MADAIYEKSNTQLSLSTIKRIWDSSYQRSFQINTLDALAQYLDYKNWHQFKEQNYIRDENISLNALRDEPLKKKVNSKRSFRIKLVFLISILAFMAIFVLLSKLKRVERNISILEEEVVFTSKKSIKEGVPNTIIFDYNIGSYKPDSLCIQLSWNPKERENIKKEDRYYTCTYYYPGYHHAKLIIDNELVKGYYVHITTKDWLTLVRETPDDLMPTYIRNENLISDGNMFASLDLLKLNNVDITADEFYVSYFNIREFDGLKADNFSFETEIKNSSDELALICEMCQIFIYGDKGTIVIPISTQGCVSDIGILAGDVRISGKTNDLSGLGCDLTDWRKVRGEVDSKHLKIFIDYNLAYELNDNENVGTIKGWHYFFKGAGAVKNLILYDSTNKIVYTDDFKR